MRKLLLIATCVLLCGTFAAAQKAELGAGWNYLHVDGDVLPSQNGIPGGFFVDGTYYFTHAIGLTGDFSYQQEDTSVLTDFFIGGEEARADRLSRWTSGKGPHGQV